MKGIVFTELLEMVEQQFDYTLVDKLLTDSPLPSGGSYTAVGTYDHREINVLVEELSRQTGVPIPDLFRAYGRYLFGRFTQVYKPLIENVHSAFDLMASVEQHIHVEVQKLYPEAELPHFDITRLGPGHMIMIYQSERKMGDFAHGLLEGCLAHFGETATITKTVLDADGSSVQFEVIKQ